MTVEDRVSCLRRAVKALGEVISKGTLSGGNPSTVRTCFTTDVVIHKASLAGSKNYEGVKVSLLTCRREFGKLRDVLQEPFGNLRLALRFAGYGWPILR